MSQQQAPERFSLHQIYQDQLAFSPEVYSRFKFGCDKSAEQLGRDLADKFAATQLQYVPKAGMVAAVSYENVPTAAYYLRKHFVRRLNEWLSAREMPLCEETQIIRKQNFYGDFSKMSHKERVDSLNKDTFELPSDVSPEKLVYFVDDIRITGSHERKIVGSLREQGVRNPITVVYYAEVCDSTIAPTLESDLNFYAFPSLDDLARLPKQGHFVINARFTKHVLSQSKEEFVMFMCAQDEKFMRQFLNACHANGWQKVSKFSENIGLLEEHFAYEIPYSPFTSQALRTSAVRSA